MFILVTKVNHPAIYFQYAKKKKKLGQLNRNVNKG